MFIYVIPFVLFSHTVLFLLPMMTSKRNKGLRDEIEIHIKLREALMRSTFAANNNNNNNNNNNSNSNSNNNNNSNISSMTPFSGVNPVFSQEQNDAKLIEAGGIMRTTKHMASFSAAVFSNAELAKNVGFEQRPRSKSEETVTTTAEPCSSTPRKRKVVSAASLVSLDRSVEDDIVVEAAPFLSVCKDSTGLMLLSFPMKLHWMLYQCELARKTEQETKTREDNNNKKPKTIRSDTSTTIIGWLSSGIAFKIFDEDRFAKEIMPIYFKGTFKDFQRDLGLW